MLSVSQNVERKVNQLVKYLKGGIELEPLGASEGWGGGVQLHPTYSARSILTDGVALHSPGRFATCTA